MSKKLTVKEQHQLNIYNLCIAALDKHGEDAADYLAGAISAAGTCGLIPKEEVPRLLGTIGSEAEGKDYIDSVNYSLIYVFGEVLLKVAPKDEK